MPKRQTPDFFIFLPAIALLAIGLVMVFSSSSYSAMIGHHDAFYYLKKQGLWAIICIPVLMWAMRVEYSRLEKWANGFVIVSLGLLVLVLIVGMASKGAKSWFGLGFASFQPSELVKLAMVFYLARILSMRQERIGSFKEGLLPPLVVLGAAAGLIMAQPDLGTATVLVGTAFLMFFAAGARWEHLALLAGVGAALVVLAIVVDPERMERLTAFMNPTADPGDSGFQTIQSLYALGSGGLFGVGLGLSKQKFLYVPERHTDFVFAILGEELGFMGCLFVLILFFFLIWRGMRTAWTARDSFGSLLAAGLTSMIALQGLMNLGVVTGTMPVTGITLPFVSYGGSSLLITMMAVGFLLNVSRYT